MEIRDNDQNENEYTIRFIRSSWSIELIIWDVDISDKFPKSLKVGTGKLYGENNSVRISTRISAKIYPDDVNQGKNETGMKRLRRFIQIVRGMKPTRIEWSEWNRFSNSIPELPAELTK